jgi:hypothetical protein
MFMFHSSVKWLGVRKARRRVAPTVSSVLQRAVDTPATVGSAMDAL